MKRQDGYVMCGAHGYEHRCVAEHMLGRPLTRHDIVHHRNGVRSDNRPENLFVMTKSEHQIHHMSPSKLSDEEILDLVLAGYTYKMLEHEFRLGSHHVRRVRREAGLG